MTVDVDRRDLLRGRLGRPAGAVRPPHALSESAFRACCDRCDACREACPEKVVGHDAEGYPILLYREAVCTFCRACAVACPTGALDVAAAAPWSVRAVIRSSCLSFNGVVCRSCGEHCDEGAIRFEPLPGGRALPLVDEDACSGCLACAAICPNGSIEMRRRPELEIAA